MESRTITQVSSTSSLTINQPFSFDIQPASAQTFVIHYLSGKGTISNTGGSSLFVTGSGTEFLKDLAVGFVILVGTDKRLITSIRDNYYMQVDAPFNYLNGGIQNSGYAFEACASGGITTVKQVTVDFATLEPGCCGFKSAGAVTGGNFAYYRVVPPSSNFNFRVVTLSNLVQLEVFVRYTAPPDVVNYDYKAVSTFSPWQIDVPQSDLKCSTTSCEPLWIGVRALSGDIPFEVASYLEFNFPSFSCTESSAPTLSAKCQALGLHQVGDANFVKDSLDPLSLNIMRLTRASSQTGAVWYGSKLHIENGFETMFTFKMSSACSTYLPNVGCGASDGFAFVIHGNDLPDQIGCGGKSLGFAGGGSNCAGISKSIAVEFDTWHNPDLRDINVRGGGTLEVNATTVARYNYVHAAFFSNGDLPNTNSHDTQIAGTPAIPTINDGLWHSARVVYIPGTTAAAPGRLFLYIDDMQSFVLTAPVRLTRSGSCGFANTDRCVLDTFGNAYIGFTASSGEISQNHDVSKWLFCDEPGCGRT